MEMRQVAVHLSSSFPIEGRWVLGLGEGQTEFNPPAVNYVEGQYSTGPPSASRLHVACVGNSECLEP